MKNIYLIICVLFMSCNTELKDEKFLTLNKDFSIQDLPLELTTDKDFEKYIDQKNTTFNITKDSTIDLSEELNIPKQLVIKDENREYYKHYDNDSLGLSFLFYKKGKEQQYKLYNYEIKKPELVQISSFKNNQLNKKQLQEINFDFLNDNLGTFYNSESVRIILKFDLINDSIKKIEHISANNLNSLIRELNERQ